MPSRRAILPTCYLALIGCIGCGSSEDAGTATPETSLAVARTYLITQHHVEWLRERGQYSTDQKSVTAEAWSAMPGQMVFEAAEPIEQGAAFVVVEFSKDFQLYYVDYYVLLAARSSRVVAVKKRKWDG